MEASQQNTGLAALEPLIGDWTMEAGPPGGPPWPGGARVTFEWLEGGAFILERWSVEMPEAPDGVAIIGCDREKGTYVQLYTDERDVHRVYEMSFSDNVWKLWREGDEPFPQRFSGELSDDGKTINARWEKFEGGAWDTDFEAVYRRIET